MGTFYFMNLHSTMFCIILSFTIYLHEETLYNIKLYCIYEDRKHESPNAKRSITFYKDVIFGGTAVKA